MSEDHKNMNELADKLIEAGNNLKRQVTKEMFFTEHGDPMDLIDEIDLEEDFIWKLDSQAATGWWLFVAVPRTSKGRALMGAVLDLGKYLIQKSKGWDDCAPDWRAMIDKFASKLSPNLEVYYYGSGDPDFRWEMRTDELIEMTEKFPNLKFEESNVPIARERLQWQQDRLKQHEKILDIFRNPEHAAIHYTDVKWAAVASGQEAAPLLINFRGRYKFTMAKNAWIYVGPETIGHDGNNLPRERVLSYAKSRSHSKYSAVYRHLGENVAELVQVIER